MRRHSCQWRRKGVGCIDRNTFQIWQFFLESGDESFIPIINAKVFCLVTGNVWFESEFLAVNKQHIILIKDHLVAQQILIFRAKISFKKGELEPDFGLPQPLLLIKFLTEIFFEKHLISWQQFPIYPRHRNCFTFLILEASQLEIFISSLVIEKLTDYGKNFRFWLLSGVIFPAPKSINRFICNSLGGSPRRAPFGIVLALNNRESICLKHL